MGDEPPFSGEEPTFSSDLPTFTSRSGGSSIASRRKNGGSRPSLSVDAIVESSQDHVKKPASDIQAKFRGYVPCGKTDPEPLPALPPSALKVVSYNVLAPRYVSTDKYRHCPTWALAEPFRCANMISEIQEMGPDLIFAQELTSDMHRSPDFGEKLRTRMGYDSFHLPISNKQGQSHALASSGSGAASSMSSTGSYTEAPRVRARGSSSDAAAANSSEFNAPGGIPIAEDAVRPEFEGVAIFYKKARFEVLEHLPVKFNILAGRDPNLQPVEKKRVSISSHNVAIVSVLKDKVTNDVLLCACTHAYWDWSRPECQLWQALTLLKEIEEMESMYTETGMLTRVIFAGDLNCERSSAAFQYITGGRVDPSWPRSACFDGYRDASHTLRLRSAYDDYLVRNPQHVTSTGPSFQGVIDHIFSDESFDVVAVARLDGAKEIPSVDVPSDHYPIAAVLLPRAPSM